MKTKFVALLISIMYFCSFAHAADDMSITINGKSTTVDALEVRNFVAGVQLFTNRTNMPINDDIPADFAGYKFLSFGGNSSQAVLVGSIIPSANGYVYVAVRNVGSTITTQMANEGWTVTSYGFTYSSPASPLTIYQKVAVANVPIKIPEVVDFRGAIPIAKNITLDEDAEEVGPADEMTIEITTTLDEQMEMRTFSNGTNLLMAETSPLKNIPERFANYNYLAHARNFNAESVGSIKATAAGKIYVIARRTVNVGEGWVAVDTFSYASSFSPLAIFEKTVTANEVVNIPVSTDLRGITPIAKKIIVNGFDDAAISQMAITVETPSYFVKTTFAEGAKYLLDRTYTFTGIPAAFNGFDFLSSNSGVSGDNIVNGGTIIPSEDGYIYLIGRSTTAVSGWQIVDNTTFSYSADLAIFRKKAKAGERIPIPIIDNFQEVKPIAKSITLVEAADPIGIAVEVTKAEENAFTKRVFTEGALFYSDRTYTVTGIPAAFNGYEFLANSGTLYEQGVIVPQADGVVYVIARSGGLPGWALSERSDFLCNGVEMSIYERTAKAGDRIEIPIVKSFQGVTPIAKTISINVVSNEQEARLDNIIIDGIELPAFTREGDYYNYYLPYTYPELDKPVVTAKSIFPGASITIAGVETVFGTEDERTATINVVSSDGLSEKTYKVFFTVLPKLDLYLCIGQSNMVGYSPMDARQGDYEEISNSYLLNGNGFFEKATNPLNRYSNITSSKNLLGPSYSFAQSINERTNQSIGLIVNAQGGSSIENWTKGGTGGERDTLYACMMSRALEAQKWGEYKAILWHQGEANKGRLDTYMASLTQFVADLRTDLGNDDLLFVAGQVGTFGINTAGFNDLIVTINQHIDNTACVSSAGLGNIDGDTNHFDRAGAIELGKRYANVISEKIYAPNLMDVRIEADVDVFEKRTLSTGVDFFKNQTLSSYKITNTEFSGFKDYEFLSSNLSTPESGVIIPSSDGYIYIIAQKGLNITEWTYMYGTELYYTNSELCIYQRAVVAGERVIIPTTTNARGITPIAKTINLINIYPEKDTRLDNLIVGGLELEDFNKDVTEYLYYLPYTATQAPVVTGNVHAQGATIDVSDASNVNGSVKEDRTTNVVVTSSDGTTQAAYKIVFQVLPELELFLCIGQSNMAGAAKLDPLQGDNDPMEKTFLFNRDNQFEVAKNGLNRYCNIATTYNQYFGPMYPFAKEIVRRTGKDVGLVVNARGGSAIELWEKTGTDVGDSLYAKTMERALEAQKWGTYKAILWHQGEGNRPNHNRIVYNKTGESINYSTAIQHLVANLRADLGDSTLPFVVGEVGRWRPDNAPINEYLSVVDTYLDYSGCASAEGLINITNLADMDGHFNRESLITLGNRYANIVYELVYDDNTVGIDDGANADKISITSKGKDIYIKCNGELSVQVSDLMGRIVHQSTIQDETTLSLPLTGVYVVIVDNTITTKRMKLLLK